MSSGDHRNYEIRIEIVYDKSTHKENQRESKRIEAKEWQVNAKRFAAEP